MELATTDDGDRMATAGVEAESGVSGGPPENPAIERIPHDPLLDPHPDEPGVKDDGGAGAPLENPGAPGAGDELGSQD